MMNTGAVLFLGILLSLAGSFWALVVVPQLQIGRQQIRPLEGSGELVTFQTRDDPIRLARSNIAEHRGRFENVKMQLSQSPRIARMAAAPNPCLWHRARRVRGALTAPRAATIFLTGLERSNSPRSHGSHPVHFS